MAEHELSSEGIALITVPGALLATMLDVSSEAVLLTEYNSGIMFMLSSTSELMAEGLCFVVSEGNLGLIKELQSEGLVTIFPDRANLIKNVELSSEGLALLVSDSSLIHKKLGMASGPNFIIKFKPYLKGGGVITYNAGAAGIATYWEIVGYDPVTGWEEEPYGSLKFSMIVTDGAGLAANPYICPKGAASVGKTDRIIVRKASA